MSIRISGSRSRHPNPSTCAAAPRLVIPYPPPAEEAVFDVCEPKSRWYDAPMPEPTKPRDTEVDGQPESGTSNDIFRVAVESGGKVVIPAAVRERLGVTEGDYLVLKAQRDGSVIMVSLEQVVNQAMGHFRDVAPGRRLADDLIAERREEARRESEE
jgi:AbrB family looped-hinge helix DNA binding protein